MSTVFYALHRKIITFAVSEHYDNLPTGIKKKLELVLDDRL